MEKYDPYNPNNLDDIFIEKKINIKKDNISKGIKSQNESIGMNILKNMGWKGKGINI